MTHETSRRARFEAVVGEVFDPLQRFIRRRVPAAEADDVLSEVLLTMWRRFEDLPEPPLPWCYGIARLSIANNLRGRRRRLRLVERVGSQAGREPVEAMPETADPALEDALSTLSASDREVVRLWAWEQLEPREIATVLRLTANAVSLRLSRARRKLASELDRQDSAISGHKRDMHSREDRA